MSIDPSCMDDYDPDSLSIEAARERILSSVQPLQQSESVSLDELAGRRLSQAIQAPVDVPSFRCSAMDGFAFRYSDLDNTTTLRIAGKSLAGHAYTGDIPAGHCVQITTGARIPDELDTVVMQEHTDHRQDQVSILEPPARGQHVRDVGSNLAAGEQVLSQYQQISASACGLLGSLGIDAAEVVRQPRIACFSTGDELIDPDQIGTGQVTQSHLQQGMIHDANRPMLLSLIRQSGCLAIDLGICRDSPAALQSTLAQAIELGADLILSTGGVSVGEADFVRQVLEQSGEIRFWKVAMKPGRPLMHAILAGGRHYFGLPGNPVSGIVTFHQFVLPAITRLQGGEWKAPISLGATLQTELRKSPGRVELQRGIVSRDQDNRWVVETTGSQDSHVLVSMQRANCYIVLDLASDGASRGETVEVIPFSGLPV